MTNHALGVGTCTQSMTIQSYLSSEMHLQKFTDRTEFQSWIVNIRTEVCANAKVLALVLQWIKKIEATSSLKDLINPKSITGKDFSDCEELELMVAAELKRCNDKYPHFQKRIRVEEQRAQKDHRFLRGSQICSLDQRSYRAWSRDKRRGANFLNQAEECYQRKTIGSCSKRDACSFLHTGDREEQASSSVPKVKKQTDVNALYSLKASPATKTENPLSMLGKMKQIVM